MDENGNVTRLLHAWRTGDETALDQLSRHVYGELKRLSRKYMAGEAAGHTLQPTALVNEAFIRLMDSDIDFEDRKHFLVVAARMMRRILVDYARAKGRKKRGEGALAITLADDSALAAEEDSEMPILLFDEALSQFQEMDARIASAVELIYFGGLSVEEAAELLEVSKSTLYKDVRFAKAWLRRAMS